MIAPPVVSFVFPFVSFPFMISFPSREVIQPLSTPVAFVARSRHCSAKIRGGSFSILLTYSTREYTLGSYSVGKGEVTVPEGVPEVSNRPDTAVECLYRI